MSGIKFDHQSWIVNAFNKGSGTPCGGYYHFLLREGVASSSLESRLSIDSSNIHRDCYEREETGEAEALFKISEHRKWSRASSCLC